ncbi:cytochrome b [Granulosicoccaceae sp. 1_MG-2023]|nr:cytochrome b [Granulosicoccaceae sp. 1_MG-2023]
MLKNTPESYGLISRILHWLIFILFVLVVIGGQRAEDMAGGPEKFSLIAQHKSVGTVILLLMLFRLVWRVSNAKPVPLAPDAKNARIAALVQMALFILMILQPLAGILMSQSGGHAVSLFGVLELPALVGVSESLHSTFETVHKTLWIAIAALVLAHAAGALKQHLIFKNRTLSRMIRG